jgi:regulator of sigma D
LRSGCHDTRLLSGQAEFKEGVVFGHTPHLTEMRRGKKLRCTSCHSQVVQGNHITVTEGTCFICHFKKDESRIKSHEKFQDLSKCTMCHKEDILLERSRKGLLRYDHTSVIENDFNCTECHTQTVIGNGPVYKQNCFACHWDNERLSKFEDTDLLHRKHIDEHKIECMQCHMDIEHKISSKDIESVADCGTCHPNEHQAQKNLYAGTGGRDVPHEPNQMYEIGLNCRGCHIFHEIGKDQSNGTTFYAKSASCEKCHGKGYDKILSQWEKITEDKLAELNQIYKRVENEVESSKKEKEIKEKAKSVLKVIKFNMNIVEKGKSVHNIRYADEILGSSYKKLNETVKLVGSDYKLPAFVHESKKIPSECSSCHYGVEEMSPSFAGVEFSHGNHLNRGLSCKKCHSNARKHGELVILKNECATCHHKQEVKKDCESCHALQRKVYKGEWEFYKKQNVMTEGVGCQDCHGTIDNVIRPKKESCLNCHEVGYDEMMSEWQSSTKNLIVEIRMKIDSLRVKGLSENEKVGIRKIESFIQDVLDDGSSGVHNPSGIEEVSAKYKKDLDEMAKLKLSQAE